MKYLLFFFVLLALPAQAAEMLEIDKAACRLVTQHQPDASVAYQPGVDVHGNAVAPADLTPPRPTIGDHITIPLTVDIAQQFGLPLGAAIGSEATVAVITVDNGKAYLNGLPLDGEDEQNLAVLCLEANAGTN
ncbi:MAG: hypothetical protein AB7G06_07390 [Bdellovibrionales bacterium]